MMLTLKMLEQSYNMELQHCLLDLLNTLSLVDMNLHQLLDQDFVDSIIKYASSPTSILIRLAISWQGPLLTL